MLTRTTHTRKNRQLCIACDFIYRCRYDHCGNAITSFSVKLKRKWPFETSTIWKKTPRLPHFTPWTYDIKYENAFYSMHGGQWIRVALPNVLTHFVFRQLQMLVVQIVLVIQRRTSIYQNMVNSVLRWAWVTNFSKHGYKYRIYFVCTYPAFSVAVMDMWCSSASRRDEPPWISAGGAACCSVVADTPAT